MGGKTVSMDENAVNICGEDYEKILESFATPVVNKIKDMDRPRDFRKSDDWKQFRFESVANNCNQCGDSNVLHLHHTNKPPKLESLLIQSISEYIVDCKEINLSNISEDDIINSVKSKYYEYIQEYKNNSNTETLCGKCHYLTHRHCVSVCQYCQKRIAPKLKRDWGNWCRTCGPCLSSQNDNVECSESKWSNIIDELLEDGEMGEAENWGTWYTGYDDIWQRAHDNNQFIKEWSNV